MVQVYVSPTDRENYTTGMNDGYWRVFFDGPYDDYESGKPKKHYKFSNPSMHGDFYLGDATEDIEDISVDSLWTSVHLKGIDFGGYPTISIWLRAWDVNPKTDKRVGPIGRIREVNVLGLSRKASPIKTPDVMDMASENFEIDDEFKIDGSDFTFARGSSTVRMAKVGDNIVIRVDGRRQRLPTRSHPNPDHGPESKEVRIPLSFANGSTILSKYETAAGNLKLAFEKRSKQPQITSPEKE